MRDGHKKREIEREGEEGDSKKGKRNIKGKKRSEMDTKKKKIE